MNVKDLEPRTSTHKMQVWPRKCGVPRQTKPPQAPLAAPWHRPLPLMCWWPGLPGVGGPRRPAELTDQEALTVPGPSTESDAGPEGLAQGFQVPGRGVHPHPTSVAGPDPVLQGSPPPSPALPPPHWVRGQLLGSGCQCWTHTESSPQQQHLCSSLWSQWGSVCS